MKRVLMILIVATVAAMAASAESYTVQEVTGRVERDAGGGRWETVTAGDTLRADAVIRTVIGSSLTVRAGDQVLAVGPMKTGKLEDIAGSGGVIRIQGRVSEVETGAVARGTGRVNTASARAGDAAAEIELVE
jgi:hypothetical protein